MLKLRQYLSHEASASVQFVKYALVGVLSTFIQVVAFYTLAATVLRCLTADDWAVRLLGLPAASANISDKERALFFFVATALAFLISNLFCWFFNRLFVFTPGRHKWYVELMLFVGVSALAMILATLIGSWLISSFGVMTTLAALTQIIFSFAFNYLARRFFIFKG